MPSLLLLKLFFFLYLGLWLNNDEKISAFLKSMGTIEPGNKLEIDHSLQDRITQTNQCIGIVLHKDEDKKSATLTSWKCDTKRQFLCSLDVIEFTPPAAKAKLPCMPSKIRKKREHGPQGQEDGFEDGKMIYWMKCSKYFIALIRA